MNDSERPLVVLAANARVRQHYISDEELARLSQFARFTYVEHDDGDAASEALHEALAQAEVLLVCQGAPRIDDAVLASASHLRFVGDLEGDRFGRRLDLDALWGRGVRVVDTTNASSYPVAEWALALVMIALRNAGAEFRKMIEPVEYAYPFRTVGFPPGELTGKTVGLIGCGHIGRRLVRYLHAFDCEIRVYDPYLPPDVADILDVLQTSLDQVLSESDAVVCLAPLTPATWQMLGAREFDLLRPGAAFVNVGRGQVVDTDALTERLQRGDITAALDVFDPEPLPADSPLKQLPNVFLSPHLAGTTAESRPRFFTLMVDELDRFFHGHQTRFDLTPRSRADRAGLPFDPTDPDERK